MEIIINDTYYLKSQENDFDLIKKSLSKHIGEGTLSNPQGEEYEKEEIIAYNVCLRTGIEKVIHLENHDKEKVILLKDFINEYKKERQKLIDLIK